MELLYDLDNLQAMSKSVRNVQQSSSSLIFQKLLRWEWNSFATNLLQMGK